MRKFILLVLALGFAIGTYSGFRHLSGVRPESAPAKLTATRSLPTNWRLRASDLSASGATDTTGVADLAGKYFIASTTRTKGMTVERSEISDRPVMAARAGRFVSLISIKDQPELLFVLNADSTVAVCADTCVESAQVAFVWCASADDCFAAVSLTEPQLTTLKALGTFRLFLQGI